jgi:hypothetical protein
MIDPTLELLKEIRECCLFGDDDGRIGVSEDVVIPSDLFNRICREINLRQAALK